MVGDWSGYLGRFHSERPGVTERVLARCFDGGQNPYEWLGGSVGDGPIVDVACGSAPMRTHASTRGYLGFDVSEAELALARKRGASATLAPAQKLPLEDASAGSVVCSMALQVVEQLESVLMEVARVLRTGGRFAAIVPAAGPLRWTDRVPVGGLVAALGRSLSYPNDRILRQASTVFGLAGLTLVADERRRFSFRLRGPEEADLFLWSLYLPGISGGRLRAARRWLRLCARFGVDFAVPVRRLIATR
ncbi:class I SAM-dependent methyltransferase [Glycomyces xiaoerkulensis]|uniref:class I SAM-dependent methyltransferase n=1 Tax=Glycomyces xiaoerkulensis TaxID=2038139 RepID=UPI000C25EBCD|nr:class I SAM-dependent methyltransferase [Glycomyces xiaoerkulensis]